MKKLVVLVDMDDTLECLLPAWISWINKKHGTSVTPSEIRDWNLHKYFPEITDEQLYEPLKVESFWETVSPMEGAIEAIEKMRSDGHEIFVVTASDYRALRTKMEGVLFKYFPAIDWSHVIVTSCKQMIRGDVLIDDGIHNLRGGQYHQILMNAPHNEDIILEDGIERVHGWQEAYEAVCRLANKR